MDKIVVRGGSQLKGIVQVEGAKNAVLPILAATLLASSGNHVLHNVPELSDVFIINKVLRSLGVKVSFVEKRVIISTRKDLGYEAPEEYVRMMRASVLVMGPLLARTGRAVVSLPGGCAIGSRPIELHLKAFQAMGANIDINNRCVTASVDGRLRGARVYFDFPSVGATENVMMAAALADGVTIIENAAQEPEIVDLALFINKMGGKISGAGTSRIKVVGVSELHGEEHTVIYDRIEAGTFMVAAAISSGNVLVKGANEEHLFPLIAKMEEMGVEIIKESGGLRVIGTDNLKSVDVKTLPHPGFPTDMQSQMMALLLKVQGVSVISEAVFENRFMHVEQFQRMNADVRVDGNSVIINGTGNLKGSDVAATDLRSASALILAGLIAEGETIVTQLKHLDRGYVDFHGKLESLGANIERITEVARVHSATIIA